MEISINKEVEGFIKSLEKQTIAKVLRTIDLLERFGSTLGLHHSKSLGQGLFELRIRGQQEVRIFYAFQHNSASLFCGFIKKSQQTPHREITKAMKLFRGLT